MKLRFSLRALLVLVAGFAAFGYWRSCPRTIVRQFERTLTAKDYAAADAHFVDPKDRFLNGWATKRGDVDIHFTFEPQTLADWLWGRCRGQFIATSTTLTSGINRTGQVDVTAAGIRLHSQREGVHSRVVLAPMLKRLLKK